MCLAIPALVVELRPNDQAVVNLGGIRKVISVALVDGGVPLNAVVSGDPEEQAARLSAAIRARESAPVRRRRGVRRFIGTFLPPLSDSHPGG